MKDQFVPYELAVKLKELGFDEECLAFYNGKLSSGEWSLEPIDTDFVIFRKLDARLVKSPLWQQAFDWFRSKGLRFSIVDDHSNSEKPHSFTTDHEYYYDTGTGNPWYKTYEEAREACLEKLIELCKK